MTTMPQLANSLEEYWMPFTANRQFKANPRIMTAAKGMYYTSDHGKEILDGSSGLFCVAAGHGRTDWRATTCRRSSTATPGPSSCPGAWRRSPPAT
jgi:beta-alanine--pyruvate transaminase